MGIRITTVDAATGKSESVVSRQYYSSQELGQMFALSHFTIRRLVAEGKIAGIRVGNSIRIPASEVDRLTSNSAAESA